MKHIVSFSGGRTSAYLVHLMEQKRKNEGWDVEYVFCDTGAEHPKTYKFISDVVDNFGIKLTCIKGVIHPELGKGTYYDIVNIDSIGWDLSVWNDMTEKYSNPCITSPFCTDRMKTTPLTKYLNDNHGKGGFTNWMGMRVDEPKRIKAKKGIRYLAEISDFEKQDIIKWWSEMPFDLGIEEHLGNCVFCFKKSAGKLALATKDEPQLMTEFNGMLSRPEVRDLSEKRGVPKNVIYRGNLTILGISKLYKDVERNELRQKLKFSKRLEGECSESCEAFGQTDMIEEL
jgi:hypothetical protein